MSGNRVVTKNSQLVDMEGFESPKDCDMENRCRSKLLRISPKHFPQALYLADKLEGCLSDSTDFCGSLACKRCVRDVRMKAVDRLVKEMGGKPYKLITLVCYSDVIHGSSLDELNIKKLKDKLRKQLERSDVYLPLIGTFEVDYHSHIDSWVPHFHLLMPACEKTEGAIRSSFRKSHDIKMWKGRIARPVYLKSVIAGEEVAAVSYVLKVVWATCVDYWCERREKLVTKKMRGKPTHVAESLLFLDSITSDQVVFEYRVKGTKSSWRSLSAPNR
ncbi:hypothetical protein BCT69_16575 [Enterovibrio norvegicus]|nr:hypothetical protein BCT69_16575 [Enterovibrio norvegicus]